MTGKVLVAYASRAGSTAEVTQAVAEVLRARSGCGAHKLGTAE